MRPELHGHFLYIDTMRTKLGKALATQEYEDAATFAKGIAEEYKTVGGICARILGENDNENQASNTAEGPSGTTQGNIPVAHEGRNTPEGDGSGNVGFADDTNARISPGGAGDPE